MTVHLSRKQEGLYNKLLKEWRFGEEPHITKEYILKTYPTDKEANKRLQQGMKNFGGFVENFEEKERRSIEHNFPGLTQYGCEDPLHDYEHPSNNCERCPRNAQCKRDVVWIKRQLDNFGRARDADGYLDSDRKKKSSKAKPKRKPVKKCKCK